MTELSERFEDTYNAFDAALRERFGGQDGQERKGYTSLVEEARRAGALQGPQADLCYTYGRLRNAMTHAISYREREYVADPHPETVAQFERILRSFTNPRLLRELHLPALVSCHVSSSIGEAVRKMGEGDITQLPILEGRSCRGILISDDVLEWMVQLHATQQEITEALEGFSVLDVHDATLDRATVHTMGEHEAVHAAVEFLEGAVEKKVYFPFLLVTKKGQAPAHALTLWDLGMLRQEAGLC